MNENEITFLLALAVAVFVLVISFTGDGEKIIKTLKKPIDVVQKKTADTHLDKKLDRLQKLGQLLKEGVITKEEFEEQKKKIEL